jgi:hypothetical protein
MLILLYPGSWKWLKTTIIRCTQFQLQPPKTTLWLPKTSSLLIPLTFLRKLSYGPGMRTIALRLLTTLLGLFQSRSLLYLEILALRQQLAMVNQTPRKRLHFNGSQRLFWVWVPGCRVPANTPGFQTRYPCAAAPQGFSTLLEVEGPSPQGRTPTGIKGDATGSVPFIYT